LYVDFLLYFFIVCGFVICN